MVELRAASAGERVGERRHHERAVNLRPAAKQASTRPTSGLPSSSGPTIAGATVLHRGEERMHICVLAQLVPKMGVPFAYVVGDYFWYPKHCALPKMRLGHALAALSETALVASAAS